jgi:hypothetical protein
MSVGVVPCPIHSGVDLIDSRAGTDAPWRLGRSPARYVGGPHLAISALGVRVGADACSGRVISLPVADEIPV